MKIHCSGRCIIALNKIQETTLLSTIKDFLKTIDMVIVTPEVFQQFYDYISMKYIIPCEVGMLFIEKITMDSVFDSYKRKISSTNSLTNDKIKLYQWIKPRHLEIKEIQFSSVISTFLKIEKTTVPSVKIFYLMSGITMLYNKIGKDMGLDTFFPYLIFCFLKSKIKDIYAHVHYMKIFKRQFFKGCLSNCNHGFQICVTCDCLVSKDWSGEEDFYLTTAIAAVEHISKLEFYNLSVEMEEFENEILRSLKKMNLKDNA